MNLIVNFREVDLKDVIKIYLLIESDGSICYNRGCMYFILSLIGL